MTTRRMLTIAALLASAAVTAQAAEMTLYENPGFGGRELTLRGYTPDLNRTGFNDRASSIAVQSGNWEVCTDADFRGFCASLAPGEYPMLDPRFNNRISSAREAGTTAVEAGRPRYEPRGAIEMYGQPGFRGRTMQLDRDAPDLAVTGFNDRASSVVVTDGTWELCSDADFGGTCRTYAPGRYPDLGYGMAKQVSSARLIRSRAEPPVVYGGGRMPPPGPADVARLVLFDGDNLRGRSVAISENVADLQRAAFNDDTASMVIEGGNWEVCTDAYFRGECRIMAPGQYRRLEPAFYRSISSVRVAPVAPAPVVERDRRGGPDVELFEDMDFGGNRFATQRDVPDLDVRGFNDKARSLIVYEGKWEMCVDGGYSGRCVVFGPGRYADLRGLNKEISSLRRVN
jgi:Beta/Gamma crystallin